MTFALKDGGEIYYEIRGKKGPWVCFLNGIMMSCASWASFNEEMSKDYRFLLIDFRDQGKSSKLEGRQYDWKLHVDDLVELFDFLSIDKINMLGVSYGGQVALEFTRYHQDRLNSLMLMNVIPKVTNYLQSISDSWELAASLNSGKDFFTVAIPPIYSDVFYQNNIEWLKRRQELFESMLTKEWFEGFTRLSKSAKYFDCSDLIEDIKVPTLVLSAQKDIITPAERMKEMAERIENSIYLDIPNSGHAAFLEKQREFLIAVKGFLAYIIK
ncbi:MAG TPA: alpha/beta hydrolase [Thermotogota bacterium]|nr:alpha/beta hydrolase [Thermotogota bacterium]HPJ89018.1 alpha/beta hydrolase [Thermotogota bacterium]HPR95529.1 alpha/beta hydrolase [Thermotogota bacterium]